MAAPAEVYPVFVFNGSLTCGGSWIGKRGVVGGGQKKHERGDDPWGYILQVPNLHLYDWGDLIIVLRHTDSTVHLSQNAPVCGQDIFRCVVWEHVSFTDISIIVADSSYDGC